MDDGYAVSPASVVFPAVLRFAARVFPLGLELQLHKSKCFSPATDLESHPARPPSVAVGGVLLPEGPARGIIVGGVPIGEASFVTRHLHSNVADMVSTISTISTKLRDRHLQALWSVTYHCLQTRFHYYWLQHCSPSAVADAAAIADQALLEAAGTCLGDSVVQECSRRFGSQTTSTASSHVWGRVALSHRPRSRSLHRDVV